MVQGLRIRAVAPATALIRLVSWTLGLCALMIIDISDWPFAIATEAKRFYPSLAPVGIELEMEVGGGVASGRFSLIPMVTGRRD